MSLIEWSGAPDEGRERLAAIADELAPSVSSLGVVPFLEIQTLTDEIFAAGKRTYIKAGFAHALTPALIEAVCGQGAQVGSEFSQIEALSMGGAISRVPVEATAFPHRDAAWLLNIPATWLHCDDDAREIAWVRESYGVISPHLAPGKYVNFMDGDEEAGGGAFGDTLARLRVVKRRYDPENVFALNQNIAP